MRGRRLGAIAAMVTMASTYFVVFGTASAPPAGAQTATKSFPGVQCRAVVGGSQMSLTPAEAAIHMSHPNLWSWRELLSGGDADSTFLAFFVVSADDAVLDEHDQRFRRLAAA